MTSKLFSWTSPKLTTRNIALTAMLVAIQVVLGKFSVGDPQVLKVGLGFIATGMVGYFLGPWLGGIAMIINDLISNTILSSGSTFFPGFTFSAFLSGVIAGIFLHHQEITLRRLFAYEFVQIGVTNVFFTTLWLHLLYGAPFAQLLIARMPKELISWPIESFVGFIILGALVRVLKGRSVYFDE